ncbi:hypothetical protein C0989_000787, partial [Termitomyces sp. Mn162]
LGAVDLDLEIWDPVASKVGWLVDDVFVRQVNLARVNVLQPFPPMCLFGQTDCGVHLACEAGGFSNGRVIRDVAMLESLVAGPAPLGLEPFEVIIPPPFGVWAGFPERDNVISGHNLLDDGREVRDFSVKGLSCG